ncbi:hypothetical protein E0765_07405 [Sulfuricurvum sp. IAE1]|uniref:hypothetical protein n=1 Tax=Sulfuricurvum sp. IAE1 TaxID=2546102 RepID=UPI00104F396F|nr:hypothetical protein [Sulfuricurvum sp. IAE1]TDA63653.1 hypothetical protein E0765_07405 [Sulfuricurvum sp. IAE1]
MTKNTTPYIKPLPCKKCNTTPEVCNNFLDWYVAQCPKCLIRIEDPHKMPFPPKLSELPKSRWRTVKKWNAEAGKADA